MLLVDENMMKHKMLQLQYEEKHMKMFSCLNITSKKIHYSWLCDSFSKSSL